MVKYLAAVMLVFCAAIMAWAEPEIAFEDNMVVAKEGETVLWQYLIPDDNDEIAPVVSGEMVYVPYFSCIITLNAADGTVAGYTHFNSPITALSVQDGELKITIQDTGYDDDRYSETITWKPGTKLSVFQDGGILGARTLSSIALEQINAARNEAELDSVDTEYFFDDQEVNGTLTFVPFNAHPDIISDAAKAELTAVIPLVQAIEQKDSLNPWLSFELAKLYYLTGSPEGSSWLKTTTGRISRSIDAMQMSAVCAAFGNQEWARLLYDQGMTLRYKEGAVPRMLSTLIQLMIEHRLAEPTAHAIASGNIDQVLVLADRTYSIAPRTEGAAGFYASLSAMLAEAGRNEEAAVWAQRSEAAEPYIIFGHRVPDWKLLNVTIVFASLLAFIASVVVLVSKHVFRIKLMEKNAQNIHPKETPEKISLLIKLNPFSTARCYEAIGVVLVAVVLILSSLAMAATLDTITTVAGMDLAAATGNPGHPQARIWYEKQVDCDGKYINIGLHHYVRGEYEQASAAFDLAEGSETAAVNKGAVLTKLGRTDEAKALWQNIKGRYAETAAYNLSGTAENYWTRQAAKYAPGEPLVVPPTTAEWEQLIKADRIFGSVMETAHGLSTISMESGMGFGRLAGLINLLLVLVAVGVIAAWRIFVKPMPLLGNDRKDWQWWLGLVPGTARQWYGFGGLIIIIGLSCLMIGKLQDSLPGSLSVIEAIAVPSMNRAYGIDIAMLTMEGLRGTVIGSYQTVLIAILVVNTALMLAIRQKDSEGGGCCGGASEEPCCGNEKKEEDAPCCGGEKKTKVKITEQQIRTVETEVEEKTSNDAPEADTKED